MTLPSCPKRHALADLCAVDARDLLDGGAAILLLAARQVLLHRQHCVAANGHLIGTRPVGWVGAGWMGG